MPLSAQAPAHARHSLRGAPAPPVSPDRVLRRAVCRIRCCCLSEPAARRACRNHAATRCFSTLHLLYE